MTEVNEVNIARGGAMAEGGGGGRGKTTKILLAVIVLAGVVAAVYFFVWPLGFLGDKETEEVPAKRGGGTGDAAATGVFNDSGARLGSADKQLNPTKFVEDPQYLELGNFIVNLKGGRRYLKVNIQVVLGNEDAKLFLEKRMADVKHVVLSVLQSRDSEQVKDTTGRTRLRNDLMGEIHTLFPPEKGDMPGDDNAPIKNVLFTEFYLQ